MDNFDLKKYLVENKVTTNSRMLTEGITLQDLKDAGVNEVDLVKLEKFKSLINSLPVDQAVGFISNELKKDQVFYDNLMKKLNPSGKSTLGPVGDEDNWASKEYYKDK